ncbi:hypothetical protein NPIL_327921 [Nephila pilipes]|uniref:Spider venom protein n=1 Tax=Nephila pilipes TaxID=299642 RepID=A0A8X6QY08_NEPPI|nr:hypothetical protein NPIL_327921 [Nephila pilipes]
MKTFAALMVLGALLGFSDGKKRLIRSIQCSPMKCEEPCYLNNNADHCPSCECPPEIMCTPPKCDYPCTIDYNTKSCPSCKCDRSGPPQGNNNNGMCVVSCPASCTVIRNSNGCGCIC